MYLQKGSETSNRSRSLRSPDDDDDCFKVAQASRHSGYPLPIKSK